MLLRHNCKTSNDSRSNVMAAKLMAATSRDELNDELSNIRK